MTTKKNIIADRLYTRGYFSEYLPLEFSTTDFKKLKNLSLDTTGTKPFSYTMNKNEKFQDRRIISIPEIGSYINSIKQIISDDILSEIITLNDSNDKTLSKFFSKDGDMRTFANPYSEVITSDKKIDQDFISNTIIKLKKSIGSVGILKLDIANFYGSFYTHNITCIGEGSEWAEKNYQLKTTECEPKYASLRNLDKAISNLNQKRTHGLLMGPLLSYIVAEGLMCTIDGELTKELEIQLEKKVDFVRFMDDYEIFIREEADNGIVISVFTRVLEKYGFVLGDRKTEYIKFPYYIYENFEEIIKNDSDNMTSDWLLNAYSKLANFEILGLQKGSMFFLSSRMRDIVNDSNYNEALALLLGIIRENAASIPVACKSILDICNKHRSKIDIKLIFTIIRDFLFDCIEKHYEWEEIWLIYTLQKFDYEMFKSILGELLKKKLNELSIIIIVNEPQNLSATIDAIKAKSKDASWLLNYELYRLDILSDKDLESINYIDKLISNFKILKCNAIKLYQKDQLST